MSAAAPQVRPVPSGEGRLLGLDLGERRIGVAVCDSAGTVATGVAIVQRCGDHALDHRTIAGLVTEYEAVGVIVGLPLSMAGTSGRAALAALDEVEELRRDLDVPVDTVDERLTTVAASAGLRAAGRTARDQRRVIDREAAAGILQSWLDRRRGRT